MNNSSKHHFLEPTLYQLSFCKTKDGVVKFVDIKSLERKEKLLLKVSKTSLYKDNEWVFQKEFPDLPGEETLLSFSTKLLDGSYLTEKENEKYLEMVKDFYYTMLTDPVGSRPKFTTYKRMINKGIKLIVSFMKNNGIKRLSDFTEYDAEEFLDFASSMRIKGRESDPITNRTLISRVAGVDWLYEQEPKMRNGLRVTPFKEYGGRSRWAQASAETVLGRKDSRTLEMPDEVAKKIFECAISDLVLADCLSEIYDIDIKYKKNELNYEDWGELREEVYKKYGCWDGQMSRNIRLKLEYRLRAACYSIIALLTGMRLHEVLNIPYGADNNWHNEYVSYEGQIVSLFFIKSKTTKLEPKPTAYQWQTVPIVKTALEALEKAHRRYFDNGNLWIFPSRRSTSRMGKGSIGHCLKAFMYTHDIRFNGVVWDLASHQFRKKFARIMIRQGLGLRALQDQLKHYDIEMTKVYGDPNIYSELQAEKFELSEELMEEFVGSQIPIIGGGSEEIEVIRKEFRGMAKKDQVKFLQSLPLRGLIEKTDDGFCFYRANKALCGGDKANCRPADCNNSFMPADGKQRVLTYRREENERLIEYFKDQPFKVAHLKARNVEINKLLDQLIPLENLV